VMQVVYNFGSYADSKHVSCGFAVSSFVYVHSILFLSGNFRTCLSPFIQSSLLVQRSLPILLHLVGCFGFGWGCPFTCSSWRALEVSPSPLLG